MKEILKKMIIIFSTIIGVIGINFFIVDNSSFFDLFYGKNDIITIYGEDVFLNANYSGLSIVGLFELIALYYIIENNAKIDNKKLKISCVILTCLFSSFLIVGNAIMLYGKIEILSNNYFLFILKFIGLFVVIYNLLFLVINKIITIDIYFTHTQENLVEKKYFTNNIISFFIVLAILLFTWLPYYLNNFPGVLTWDAITQIKQFSGVFNFNTSQPFIHTMLMGIAISLGEKIFGTINAGVALYVFFQSVITGSFFSFTIYYLAKKKVNYRVRLIVLLFYSFFPLIPIMNVILTKDTIFSVFMLLFLIVYYELLTNYENLFKSKIKIISSSIVIIMLSLFRNNSIYAIVMTIPFLSFFLYLNRKVYQKYILKILSLFIISCIIVIIFNFCLNSILISSKDDYIVEAYYNSLIQQLVRATIDNEDKMTKYEREEIYSFFYVDNLKEVYIPYLTDNVKSKEIMNQIYFKNHKKEFMTIYFKMMIKYPVSYLNSILCTTSGYFDIEETRVSIWLNSVPNDLGIKNIPIINISIINFIEHFVNYQHIPIIGLMFSTSFPNWIIIIYLFICIYKKRNDLIVFIIPLLLYFVTIIFGPLNGESRYIYYLYICIPFLISIAFSEKERKEEL